MLFLRHSVHHHHSVTVGLNSKLEQAISDNPFVRILVVDDFAPWRRFLIAKLRENRNLRIGGVVSDGLEAVLKAEELHPDLILLDIGLPKMNGIEAARRIHKIVPNSKILFLSQELDLDVTRAGLSAGGHGYVVKSDADNELFAAIEAVMSGNSYVSLRLTVPTPPDALDSQTGRKLGSEGAIAPPPYPSSRGER